MHTSRGCQGRSKEGGRDEFWEFCKTLTHYES
jgi:hypothetical protein